MQYVFVLPGLRRGSLMSGRPSSSDTCAAALLHSSRVAPVIRTFNIDSLGTRGLTTLLLLLMRQLVVTRPGGGTN